VNLLVAVQKRASKSQKEFYEFNLLV